MPPPDRDSTRDRLIAALVDRHARFLFRVALSALGHREDAEDAVQDTFLKLHRAAALPAMAEERAYLARAVWRAALDRRTTASARALHRAEDVSALPLEAPEPSPEDAALASADRALLSRLVADLPDDLRQPLLLSAVEEMRSAEIAVILQIPDATVRTRIHRARQQLRARFLALTAARPRPQEALP